jgi:hypothetical protein
MFSKLLLLIDFQDHTVAFSQPSQGLSILRHSLRLGLLLLPCRHSVLSRTTQKDLSVGIMQVYPQIKRL